MNRKRWAVVLVVDRLGAGFLGPYGNTWLDTPAFNSLAAQSALFENGLADSPKLDMAYRSYWRGWHAFVQQQAAEADSLPARLAAAGLSSMLITDEAEVANHSLENAFSERVVVAPEKKTKACREIDHTQLAELFSTAIEHLQDAEPPDLVWIHSRGMQGEWDAPLSFRQRFADEDDPAPPEFVEPPLRMLSKGFNPDELLGLTHAYAGQVAVLDLCLATLLEVLDEHPRKDDLLLIVTSPRGYPLGEHLRVGPVDEALYGELLHVPLLVRVPGMDVAMHRDHALAQPADLHATLLDWFNIPPEANGWGRSWLSLLRGERTELRPFSCAVNGGERTIRTPAWFLRQRKDETELFVKPDDRWEVNNIATRCVKVLEPLQKVMDDFALAAQQNQPAADTPLEESLRDGFE